MEIDRIDRHNQNQKYRFQLINEFKFESICMNVLIFISILKNVRHKHMEQL